MTTNGLSHFPQITGRGLGSRHQVPTWSKDKGMKAATGCRQARVRCQVPAQTANQHMPVQPAWSVVIALPRAIPRWQRNTNNGKLSSRPTSTQNQLAGMTLYPRPKAFDCSWHPQRMPASIAPLGQQLVMTQPPAAPSHWRDPHSRWYSLQYQRAGPRGILHHLKIYRRPHQLQPGSSLGLAPAMSQWPLLWPQPQQHPSLWREPRSGQPGHSRTILFQMAESSAILFQMTEPSVV